MSVLCTINARGGSKGVANKNIRPMHGRPLIAWTIEQARASGVVDFIAMSSDSKDILQAAKDAGADLLVTRPDELATDQAAKVPAIRHSVETAEAHTGKRFDVLVDLDATSPLRLPSDIEACIELLRTKNAPNVITAMPARRSPYFNLVEVHEDGRVTLAKPLAKPVVRRQDAPKCYDMNASIYVWRHDALFEDPAIFKPETALYIMPEERSIDIDSELDFRIVEMILAERLP
ncbi:MAG: acylneuraminate cytidylyltransferase family protein [Rhodospirillaceae bacterium]|nr:acylneuraminate cytidylyltransferase family protein [Rhodospirillaceae bacterium]